MVEVPHFDPKGTILSGARIVTGPAPVHLRDMGFGWGQLLKAALLMAGLVFSAGCGPSGNYANPAANDLIAMPDTARLLYVDVARLNCRAEARARSRLVTSLTRGTQISVEEERSAWSRIAVSGRSCWVLSRYLATQASTAAASGDQASPQYSYAPANVAAPTRSSRHSTARRTRGYDGGGACPCRSGRICIGPRGGRYCITSGGNKRYGV